MLSLVFKKIDFLLFSVRTHYTSKIIITFTLVDESEIIKILAGFKSLRLHLALKLQIDDELRADSLLALDLNRSTHLFDDLFANGQAKTSSALISIFVLCKSAKVNE